MRKAIPFFIGCCLSVSVAAQIDLQQSGDRTYETLDARQVADGLGSIQSQVDTLLSDVADLESVVTAGSNAAAAAGRVNADGTLLSGYNMTSTLISTGNYAITFDIPLGNADYAIMVQPIGTTNDTPAHISPVDITTMGFIVKLGEGDNGGGAEPAVNRAFSVIVVAW